MTDQLVLKTLPTRFLSRISENGQGCWVWRTPLKSGYGLFTRRGVRDYTHRIVYRLAKGEIPAGLQIDHLCRNRACCNPDHLEAVTQRENIARGDSWKTNGLKTHCPRGHAYTAENVYITTAGGRRCRACERARYERDKLRAERGTGFEGTGSYSHP